MIKAYIPKKPLRLDGFKDNPPETVLGHDEILIVYRAYGGVSEMIGSCYFTPQVAGTARLNWTAELLEDELNVVLWGNELRRLAKFRVRCGTTYRMGAIAQDKYQGEERKGKEKIGFDQYAYFKNSNLFFQVLITSQGDWQRYLDLLDDVPIKSTRLVRQIGHA